MTAIITRTGKGSPISQAENDSNLDSLCSINEAQTGTSYTVNADDQNNVIEFSNVSAITVTLSLISTLLSGIDTSDFKLAIKNVGAGIVTVTPTTNTFDDGDLTKTLSQYEWITIQTDSTETKWNVVESSNSIKVNGLNANQFLRSDANDSATGDLTLSGSVTLSGGADMTAGLSISGAAIISTATELNYLDGSTSGTALTTGDEGSGNGMDADTVDGSHAADLLARANHTGTQTLSTISDVTASAAELNDLAGNAVDASDFTKLSQVTASAAELNLLTGITTNDLNFRGALVFLDANQSILDATSTDINFDQESYDTSSIHDNIVNNERLTVPSGVTKVRLSARCAFQTSSANLEIWISKNGSISYTGMSSNSWTNSVGILGGNAKTFNSPVLTVIAGDYFSLTVRHDAGFAINVTGEATGYLTWLSMAVIE